MILSRWCLYKLESRRRFRASGAHICHSGRPNALGINKFIHSIFMLQANWQQKKHHDKTQRAGNAPLHGRDPENVGKMVEQFYFRGLNFKSDDTGSTQHTLAAKIIANFNEKLSRLYERWERVRGNSPRAASL